MKKLILVVAAVILAATPAMASAPKKQAAAKACSFTYGGGTYNFGPDGTGTWTGPDGRSTWAKYTSGTVTYQRFSGAIDTIQVGNKC